MAEALQPSEFMDDNSSIFGVSTFSHIGSEDKEAGMVNSEEVELTNVLELCKKSSYASALAKSLNANETQQFGTVSQQTFWERDNFHHDNVTADRACTAYFNSGVFSDSKAVFETLEVQNFPHGSIRCYNVTPLGKC